MTRVRFPSPALDQRGESPLDRRFTILGAAAGLLFALGVILAVAQPGNLGDDDGETAAATSTTSSSSTTFESTTSSSAGFGATSTSTVGVGGAGETTTTMGATTTTAPSGSGLGADGNGSMDDARDLADSGGPAWVLPAGAALLVASIGSRRVLVRGR